MLLVLAIESKATLLSFDFTGDFFSGNSELMTALGIGTSSVLGTYTYDDATPSSSSPTTNGQRYTDAVTAWSFANTAYTFSAWHTNGFIDIVNYSPGQGTDRYYAFFKSDPASPVIVNLGGQDFIFSGASINLLDTDGIAHNTESIQDLGLPVLSAYPTAFFQLTFVDVATGHSGRHINWSLTSLDTEPIPEPTTIVLMGFGLLGILGVVIRQRRKGK